jgi:hypothetical protein
MALTDLYSPRIAIEQRESEFRRKAMLDTLGQAAAQLFEFSAKQDYNKRAFANAQAEAAANQERLEWERTKFWEEQGAKEAEAQDEFKHKRRNAAIGAAVLLPPEKWTPAMQETLSEVIYETSGVRIPGDQLAKQPDIVQRLYGAMTDPKTGLPTPEAQKYILEAGKPMTDVGKTLGDIQMLREKGLDYDDPQIQYLIKQLNKQVSTDIGSQEGRYVQYVFDNYGPEAGLAAIKEIKAAGAAKAGDIKITLPGEGERKEVTAARGTLQMLNDIDALYTGMKADGVWTVGPGVETAGRIASFVPGLRDPRAKALYATITKVQSDMLRIASGLAQTDPEIRRQMGYVMRGDLSPQEFRTALDLNIKWAKRHLQNMREGMEAYGQVTPPMPEAEGPPKPEPAARENQTGVAPPDKETIDRFNKLDDRIKKMERRKKLEQKKGGRTPAETETWEQHGAPPGPSSEAQMFQRYIG